MSHLKGLPDALNRDKPRWREAQMNLPIGAKVALLGQVILETMELEKIKKPFSLLNKTKMVHGWYLNIFQIFL